MNLKFPAGCPHFKDSDWADYQLQQYRQLVRYAPHQTLAIDCGAHAGIMTRRMSADFKQVISFEPVHYNLLTSNTADLNNVKIHPYGLLDAPAIVPIHINTENSGDCVVGAGDDSIEVTTIDSLDIEGVSVIKMDIQGSEYPALQGARETILHDHPTLMIETERWDPNGVAIEDFLLDMDYVMVFQKNADRIWRWTGWR